MYGLPIFFFFLLYNAPSGLILYWLTSNILGVAQQLIINKDTFTMVATDGRRLSCVNKSGFNVPDFQPAIVPVKILSCVLKNAPDEGNIKIAIVEKSIFIKFANLEFSSVLIDGQFPNYQKVIPENLTKSIMVNKNDLDAALKRTTLQNNPKYPD